MKERFLKKVKKTNTCWLWEGKTQSDGYGEMWHPVKKKLVTVHRLAYEFFVGKIPKGRFVCHTCDVRHCVNPDHLWLGTNRDNIVDAAKKGKICNQKLSIKDVKVIRELANSGETHKSISEQFGVSRVAITRVVNKSTFAHV